MACECMLTAWAAVAHVDCFPHRLLAGKSGVKEISRFDASEFPTRFAAQIENFQIDG